MIPIRRVFIQWASNMENRIDFVTIAAAVCIAGYVAITLWYVALYDFGLTREAVRSGATVAAILIGAAVAIDFFGKKSGKAE
jgi:hypothetical protein